MDLQSINSIINCNVKTIFILIYAPGVLQFIVAKMTVLSENLGQK